MLPVIGTAGRMEVLGPLVTDVPAPENIAFFHGITWMMLNQQIMVGVAPV